MVNRLARAARRPGVFDFSGEARLTTDNPDGPTGGSAAATAAASLFAGLSNQLGKMADRAAKQEGEAEGLAAGMEASPSRPDPEAPRVAATEPASTGGASGGYYDRVVGVESGGNPNAKNPLSSATGLGQFTSGTWRGVIKAYRPDLLSGRSDAQVLALRKDPKIAREMLQHFTQENARELKSAGFAGSDSNLYLMHFAGKKGAVDVLRAPDNKPVEQILDAGAISANKFLRGMTAGDLKAWSARKMGGGTSVTRTANKAGPAGDVETVGGIPIHEPLPGAPISPVGAPPVAMDPPAPPAPLALRRDNTIKGEAHDQAAVRIYGAKLDAAIRADTAAAYEQHKDDPAALKARLEEVRTAHEADASYDQDPNLKAAFEARFSQQSAAYMADANARAEQRIDNEAKATALTALSGARQDIERQAYLVGANPSLDQDLEGQLARLDRAADQRAARGDITFAQRDALKRDTLEAVIGGKIRGTFDALPDAAAKLRFASDLEAKWAGGEGDLAKLDRKTVATLASSLTADARREAAEGRVAGAADRALLKRRLKDDVASISSSGKNLVEDGVELTEGSVAAALGQPAADQWVADRQRARSLFAATADLKFMPAEDIEARLATLAPAPGSEGYADAEKVQEQAEREAARILKQRAADPGKAADEFPAVKAAKEARDPRKPETFQAVAQARLDAQDALGVPEEARNPLSNAEAKALIAPVVQAAPGAEHAALTVVLKDVESRYGRHADAVAVQLLEQTGVTKYEAETGMAILKSLRRSQPPSMAQGRAADAAGDVGAADRAMSGKAAATAPQIMSRAGLVPQSVKDRTKGGSLVDQAKAAGPDRPFPLPNRQQLDMLQRRPDLRNEFEAKFGVGSVDYYLRPSGRPEGDDE